MKRNYFATLVLAAMSLGATAQITQVTDINKTGDSGIGTPTLFNGEIYFEADAGDEVADELYKYTGSEVVLVKDINQDPSDSSPNSDPKSFIEYAGKLYMNANGGDYTGSDLELYVTDGTEAGTSLAYDFNTVLKKGGNPQNMFVFNNKLYMQANDGTSTQWWSHDDDTTVKVTDINSGGYASNMYPKVDEANGRAWFQANESKAKLFYLDTNDSTIMLTISGSATNTDCNLKSSIVYNNGLLFEGDDAIHDDELWFSNGTQEGTVLVKDINTEGNSDPENFTEYNGTLYFTATVGDVTQLWKTDATEAGTEMVLTPEGEVDTEISNLIVFAGQLYYTLTAESGDEELWAFDGTTATLVATVGDSPSDFIVVDNILFFIANDDLWSTTGITQETRIVYTLFAETAHPVNVSGEYVVIGSTLYFTGDDSNGDEIFSIDAATITDYSYTLDFSYINNLFVFEGEVYFEGDADNGIGDELYKQTIVGDMALVSDINQDTADSSPNGDPKNFIEYDDKLYFNGNGGDFTGSDSELYGTNGNGASLIYDFNTELKKAGNPQNMFVFNDKLYMQANDGTSTQWWAFDGDTTVKVTTINSNGWASPTNFIVDEDNDRTWFQANETKAKLFILDANDSTYSVQISGEATNTDCLLSTAILFNGGLLFEGDNGIDGDELWYSDGTDAGTHMIKNINAGDESSDPSDFALKGDIAYFIASSDSVDAIWSTDGTEVGTQEEYLDTADVENLFVVGDNVIFTQGNNILRLTSTGATTVAAFDTTLAGFYAHNDLMFFIVDDALWYTDGYAINTKAADYAVDISGNELVSNGTKLHYKVQIGDYQTIEAFDAAEITLETPPASSIPDNNIDNNDVVVYPMPSYGDMTISGTETFTSYKVFDFSMKQVATSNIEDNKINVSLPAGMYILQLINENNAVAKSIIIQ